MGVLPGAPSYAALVQLQETLRSDRRDWGWKSLTRHQFQFAHVVQRRDGALKTRTVSVQVRPWALVAVCKHPRVVQLEEAFRSKRKGCRCESCHADQFGMSTGRASRASVLTSACLRASGASPRHSAICSCSPTSRGTTLRASPVSVRI